MVTTTKKKSMETYLSIVLLCTCLVVCGCEEPMQNEPVIDKSLINTMQIKMLNDIAMENAIVTQRTLYPYHFIINSEQLNELGHRDLSIIMEHFKNYPGPLNVRQGDTPSSIYLARVAYVSEQFENAGVDMANVSIVDDMPGGTGMPTDDVVEIQQTDRKARTDRREKYPRINDRSFSQ